IRLGTCIAPVGNGKEGRPCVTVSLEDKKIEVNYRDMVLIPLGVGEKKEVIITPTKSFDVGAGKGKQLKTLVDGGIVGLIIDARGRPFELPEDNSKRIELLTRWNNALAIYPEKM
ncbi:unnamed protein product, partial [marine sediment metagenome]